MEHQRDIELSKKMPRFLEGRMKRGFALVATITLLPLLALLAVTFLSYSSISSRESGSLKHQQEAQNNARMGLMIALGELQRHAGPDTRITATSNVIDGSVRQGHLTGVWDSTRFLDDPSSPVSLNKNEKNSKFRTWLCSSFTAGDVESVDYVRDEPGEAEVLLSADLTGSLTSEVSASRVPIYGDETTQRGSYAYCVLDEGVKARVNLGYKSPDEQLASHSSTLGGGQRPGIDRIDNTGLVDPNSFSLSEAGGLRLLSTMVTSQTAELAYEADAGVFNEYRHDLTSSATGLMCDVTKGGFKRDLNLISEGNGLPTVLAGKSVYEDAFGLSIPSDPSWESLISYLNLYRGSGSAGDYLMDDGGVPVLRASAPSDWNAGSKVDSGPADPNTSSPSGPVLLPSIAKVQMIFSLAARDIYRYPIGSATIPDNPGFVHSPWAPFFREPLPRGSGVTIDSKYDYLLHMVYTPVITLHNPYNVAIEFNELRVEFVDVPFSLQVFRNGVAQSKGMVPLNAMYGAGHGPYPSKRFGLTLSGKDDTGSPDGSSLRLAPGEVKIFSPYIPPSRTWEDEIRQPMWFADWANNNAEDGRIGNNEDVDTSRIRAVSGWRGDGIGFDLDSFAPGSYNAFQYEEENGHKYQRNQCIGLRKEDELYVEFAPIPDPSRGNTKFTLEMTLIGANDNVDARTSVVEFDYETEEGLQTELLGAGGKIRYPEIGSVSTLDIFDHASVPIGSTSNTKAFALFTASAKTTFGGFNGSNKDGGYASKPWSFHNHSALTASQNIVSEHSSHHSHEINLIRLPGSTDEVIEIQPDTDRGRFITGLTTQRGIRMGAIHNIPLGPAQNMTMLNTALPAATYYLPRFNHPVGNSFAHPLISMDSFSSVGPAGYLYADHSFLLNTALYDGYYFSGIQTRGGAFGDGLSAGDLTTQFLAGEKVLTDTRFVPYLADGATLSDAEDVILGGDGFASVGSFQMLNGAFNVNSTSIEAWRAMLSSMTGKGASILRIPSGSGVESIESLNPNADIKGARFSRFGLPNGQPSAANANSYWQSPHDIGESELTDLASEIVNQVRLRGPFLSMSDFVNRQVSDDGGVAISGALQAAIDNTGINSDANLAGYEIEASDLEDHELSTPSASVGSSAQGAPGYLTQADLLAVLGNAATVRSDTFVIRAYGDSRDSKGNVLARAWCEATVQRFPEYVDSADSAVTLPDDLTSEFNRNFGRRFKMISFRWLSPFEI